MRRTLVALAAAALLVSISTMPAQATGPVMPPGIPDTPANQFYYSMWFGPAPDGSTPVGEIVADSGMRPYPNGFPYANYGADLSMNQLFFGTPDAELERMTSATMRDLYGDEVCIDAEGLAPGESCDLTPAAEYFAEYLFETANGVGHCVGMSVTAAGIFNGELSPRTVGATTLTGQSVLGDGAQQTILRNWSTQFTTTPAKQTPAQVVETLIETLEPGAAPWSIVITWVADGRAAGHGITPYAVYDRGSGLFDIAVYDNNFPGQSRAIHVDTVANTWEYLVSVNPSSGSLVAQGDATTFSLGLVSVEDALETQSCPICKSGRPTTLLGISPIPASQAGKLDFALVSPGGEPIPQRLYDVLPALDSSNPRRASLPAVSAVSLPGWQLVVYGMNLTREIPVQLHAVTNAGAAVVHAGRMAPGTVGAMTKSNSTLGYGATTPSIPRLQRTFARGDVHYSMSAGGGSTVAAMNSRTMAIRSTAPRVVIGDEEALGGRVTVAAEIQTARGMARYRAKDVRYPTGGRLVLVYKEWTSLKGAPTLWVDRDGDGSLDAQVRMHRINVAPTGS